MKLNDENFDDVVSLASFMIETIAARTYITEDGMVDWTAIYEEVQTSYRGPYSKEMAELAIVLIEESAAKYEEKVNDEYYVPPGTTFH